jgi:hypothetical protein
MGTTAEVLRFGAHQPDIGFMDKSRCLERLAGRLSGNLLGGQMTQLLVDQRKKLVHRTSIALLDGYQNAGYIAHDKYFYWKKDDFSSAYT